MAFNLPDHFVWDFWLADDGEHHHLYFLHAPRSLGNPHLRHRNARIGHATSTDLRNWTFHGQIFDAGSAGAFDASATWTGSVVRAPDGSWRMFYTGSRFLRDDADTNIETIGMAYSRDLFSWTKHEGPVCLADAQWYEVLPDGTWPEEAWRDPWVFWKQDEQLWHMLITARARFGEGEDRGIVGHATSPDLDHWTVQAPLSGPGSGFGHLEVFQIVEVEGRNHLVFCCGAGRLVGARAGHMGGVWSVPVGDVPGPIDPGQARLLVPQSLYAGRIAKDRTGRPWLLAFNNIDENGYFAGGICDPLPVTTDGDGYLVVGETA